MQHLRVKKDWGEEELIANRAYCGKILRLKQGRQCSLHFHAEKDETFYVLDGKVRLELNGWTMILGAGDSAHVAPGRLHRFAGLTDATIIEFSTHHEDGDSHRIEKSRPMAPDPE